MLDFLNACSNFFHCSHIANLESCVFGCVGFVHVHKKYHNKLDPRVVKCIFWDNAPNKRGTNVITLLVFLSPKMSDFMNMCHTSIMSLISMGEHKLHKVRITIHYH